MVLLTAFALPHSKFSLKGKKRLCTSNATSNIKDMSVDKGMARMNVFIPESRNRCGQIASTLVGR
jgi:hypothetical protein